MENNSNAKIIQAVFSFLEVVVGKKDDPGLAGIIREMIDELIISSAVTDENNPGETVRPWDRLDHDLRTPMNGILGFSEILLEEARDPEQRWKAEQIHESALRLMRMLEKGSIYRFNLPVEGRAGVKQETVKPSMDEPHHQEPPVKKKAKSAGKKLPNVLIVEDNMVNSNLLQQHIKKRCHLFFSQTGKAAVEVARTEKIDAIFMDINLGPGIDGTQAMIEIRKQLGNENLPVVAVTGFAGREDREKFLQAGFNEFIAKPFERQEVISVLEKLFPPEE
jgi:CheY-like chemotaxis protein